jgi:hypothetical protein
MAHVFEPAPTGRARCRGCEQPIAKGELRFGERIPNPFGEGEATLLFHPLCAAYRRPEVVLEALESSPEGVDREALARVARATSAHRRLPRILGAERAKSSQAKCRHCHQPIERGTWRIRLVFYEEGRFVPSGTVHLDCRDGYFEGHDAVDAILHFSAALPDDERAELARACGRTPAA